ncbi:hypothetical protein [Mesorhizobium sp. M7A.F.Ce.TU.012.03.2.1]|uniref:hypothetical protein n=1 Tax=Mesorhizobium sp. M7A.F.Ce.TU.012.03.2.1 TaxID=2493681 RepID=UPI000FDAB41F|nr:hypothetical protein [Mesorhizobium sp. M7A.F.Ce.TU.012.03.2.1]AZV19307.1 hypothetical protein EJ079_09465 [Mesorhizobium sp. M7A.F.Ce.TU.012.03.2.1]
MKAESHGLTFRYPVIVDGDSHRDQIVDSYSQFMYGLFLHAGLPLPRGRDPPHAEGERPLDNDGPTMHPSLVPLSVPTASAKPMARRRSPPLMPYNRQSPDKAGLRIFNNL